MRIHHGQPTAFHRRSDHLGTCSLHRELFTAAAAALSYLAPMSICNCCDCHRLPAHDFINAKTKRTFWTLAAVDRLHTRGGEIEYGCCSCAGWRAGWRVGQRCCRYFIRWHCQLTAFTITTALLDRRQLSLGVAVQMTAQVSALVEATLADGALVRRLLQMGHLVHGERARLAETLAAIAALEWLLLGVYVAVVAQMILSAECLAANVARIRPLIGVCTFVNEQVIRFGEMAIAVLANELLLWSAASTVCSASQLHGRG